VHHVDSWIKIDQLGFTCFFISLFTAQHVSNVSTSIFRSLRLICRVISYVVLLWFYVCWFYGVVRLGWCGIRMQAEALVSLFNAQHVSKDSTSIFRSLRLICRVISCVVLFWYDVCWCYGVVRLRWCGIRMEAETLLQSNTTNEITLEITRKLLKMDVLTFEKCWAVNSEIIK
jgi:hypothetical protein